VEVEPLTGAGAILERAWPFLVADEPRHNLALGILSFTREHSDLYPDVHAWLVREGDNVVGMAMRTPPYNLMVARPLSADALEAIADAVDTDLPGVVGAVPEVDAFAAVWTTRRGVHALTSVDQRIYSVESVERPRGVDGTLRLADPADRELVLAWVTAFGDEALHGADDPGRIARSVDARLGPGSGGIGLWEAGGEPVSLAGFSGETPNGLRIGPVYTPPALRGRGYGSAVTAAVSQLALDRGKRFCFLYTDLANPTSNAIYLRIGYAPVCDSRELAFVPR